MIELTSGAISGKECCLRFATLFKDKWHNIEEIIGFDRENKISSTFFIGVTKGMGLCYSIENSEFWINKILQKKFDVGLHGITFDNFEDIKNDILLPFNK